MALPHLARFLGRAGPFGTSLKELAREREGKCRDGLTLVGLYVVADHTVHRVERNEPIAAHRVLNCKLNRAVIRQLATQ